jgi:hypothetical protein
VLGNKRRVAGEQQQYWKNAWTCSDLSSLENLDAVNGIVCSETVRRRMKLDFGLCALAAIDTQPAAWKGGKDPAFGVEKEEKIRNDRGTVCICLYKPVLACIILYSLYISVFACIVCISMYIQYLLV